MYQRYQWNGCTWVTKVSALRILSTTVIGLGMFSNLCDLQK
ncbi:hypothetical protein [Spiroplasma endosymbiont of Danaus chrysippus]|nr:hypothetical protein [Spiroplasma endosymbiont of Danaus chrysippus]